MAHQLLVNKSKFSAPGNDFRQQRYAETRLAWCPVGDWEIGDPQCCRIATFYMTSRLHKQVFVFDNFICHIKADTPVF